MQRIASPRHEEPQVPSPSFVVTYAVMFFALLLVDVAGYGLIALTA
jgi:hypothetical protein